MLENNNQVTSNHDIYIWGHSFAFYIIDTAYNLSTVTLSSVKLFMVNFIIRKTAFYLVYGVMHFHNSQ